MTAPLFTPPSTSRTPPSFGTVFAQQAALPVQPTGEMPPGPAVALEAVADAPVSQLNPAELRQVAARLTRLFEAYANDRLPVEAKYLRNLRQYMGQYDPEVEKGMTANRSRAYPRVTRVKCISTRSRIMNLMFPGNERNWELTASPNAEMRPEDTMEALETAMQKQVAAGLPPKLTDTAVQAAIQALATERARRLTEVIDDQLQEIGGDQTSDYVALMRQVLQSGILYGVGLLRGPFARAVSSTTWTIGPDGQPAPQPVTTYKPLLEFQNVWDYYPDMSAKTLDEGEGYFTRLVMSRAQVRALARREGGDFLVDTIKNYLATHPQGNYKQRSYEGELRALGVKEGSGEQRVEGGRKYEVIIWNGPLSGQDLRHAGVTVTDEQLADDLDAELWMLDGEVIKAALNPWAALGVSVRMMHTFVFDEDDTSPIGDGLPNVVRDSQLAVAAAARMLLDNASVACGPNLEVNLDLLLDGQDIKSVEAWKIWYREGMGAEAQLPAVRNIAIDSRISELLQIIDLFMRFADLETFVGPATGGDMDKQPSEPMRTAAGASMIHGNTALPFKDIIRNFDKLTMSVITSLVQFNRKFNPALAPAGDFNVIARGATSLIAKEVRGMQVDQLATTLTPEERIHIDERKLIEARVRVRDLGDLLVSPDEVERRQQAQSQDAKAQSDAQLELLKAEIRKTLADAYKGIAQGQKNTANADAASVQTTLDLLEAGLPDGAESPPAKAAPAPRRVPPAPPAPLALAAGGAPQGLPPGMAGGLPPAMGAGLPPGMAA